MNRIKITILSLLCICCSINSLPAQQDFVGSASDQLIQELFEMDSILFDAAFNICNPDKVRELVLDDFEFYHDKYGLIATSGEQFVQSIKSGCEAQASGQNNRAKRELVRSTLKTYPLNNYGAMQIGEHRFYQLMEGKYQFTEVGRFTTVWKKENDQWKVSRVLSYDHSPKDYTTQNEN